MPPATVEVPEVGTVQATGEGCRARARTTLYGSPPERWLFYMFFSDNFKHRVRVRAAADPGLATLNRRWSSCMSGEGHPGLRDPAQARVLAAGYDTPDAWRREIALATADAVCEESLGYVESGVLGMAGGVVGGLAGLDVAIAVALAKGWTAAVSGWLIAAAPITGLLVGLAAGLYPAVKAGRVEPLAALTAYS